MSFLSRFSKKIERQNWDHVPFLRNLMVVLVLVLLIFYVWILSLANSGLIEQEQFNRLLRQMLYGQIIGLLIGIIISFLCLLPYYLRKEWDLHIVVPNGLFFHMVISVIIFFVFTIFNFFEVMVESSGLLGYLIGGLIPILAYSGEVKKERQEPSQNAS